LGVVLLVVQLALFFSRNITEPVSQTALALQTIAEEQDLTVQVEVEQQDEIGQMAEAMRQMVSQLNSALQHVEWSSRQVQQESSVLESTGRQLAEQSSTQAASLEEISSSMVELNAQTKHNHELSTQASSRSQQMSRQAQASSEQMQRFSKMMAEIESSTENVTQITSLISEIAAQTRMLAINASIEAARAGVHGAGFAVVAQEVQELSAQTAESAEEIARVVGASVEKVQSGRKFIGRDLWDNGVGSRDDADDPPCGRGAVTGDSSGEPGVGGVEPDDDGECTVFRGEREVEFAVVEAGRRVVGGGASVSFVGGGGRKGKSNCLA
jgi:methyl-accepting chemotaxis protein